MDFGHFVDRVFWLLLTSAALYCANAMREMGKSIEELNRSMAVVVYQSTESRERLNKIDMRIDRLEERVQRGH